MRAHLGVMKRVVFAGLVMTALLVGCSGFAEFRVQGPGGEVLVVDQDYFQAHLDEAEGSGREARLPLERALADSGYLLIDRVILTLKQGGERDLSWEPIAGKAWLLSNGQVTIDGQAYEIVSMRASEHADLDRVEARITDLAPTTARALGLYPPSQSQGVALEVPEVESVLLLFLDGFGYLRYQQALEAGLIPNLATLSEPLIGLTTYPPITTVSTASVLTGAPPSVHGAGRRGIRMTEVETIFDVADAAGLAVRAVEGEALAFQLRGAEFELSGDRNANGMTDDEVLENALAVIESGVSDLFWVHFHGIDDAGHTYGPGTPQESEVVRYVDSAVGALLEVMPERSLVLIFADHGMHAVEGDGRRGNHGHLIALDMLVPIFVVRK